MTHLSCDLANKLTQLNDSEVQASIITHALTSCSLGYVCYGKVRHRAFWLACTLLGILPDADVIGFRFGVKYEDILGHRGFFHSLLFCAIVGCIAMLCYRRYVERKKSPFVLWFFFACAMATHPLLDACTTGGLGVAFFSPFDTTRYFFAHQVIKVSPIGVGEFFSWHGVQILLSEFKWVWLPCMVAVGVAWVVRLRLTRK